MVYLLLSRIDSRQQDHRPAIQHQKSGSSVLCFSSSADGRGISVVSVDPAGCASQLKLTSILSSTIFLLIIYCVLINWSNESKCRLLYTIGDYSFGIYLVHILFQKGLQPLEFYSAIPYPITSVIILAISFIFCYVCTEVMGKRVGRWLGFI